MGTSQSAFAQRHGRFRFEQHYYAPAAQQAPAVETTAASVAPAPVAPASETVAQVTPSDPAPKLTPIPATAPATGVSCCEGSVPGGKCAPECLKGKNPPDVTDKCKGGTELPCIDIPEDSIVPGIPKTTTKLNFYSKCVDHTVKIPVPLPAIEIINIERCEFKKRTYTVDECCEFTVCVPCRSCVTETKKCVLKPSETPYKVSLCYRNQGGTVDVYVYGVPGMPARWLLYMDANEKDVKSDLKIQ